MLPNLVPMNICILCSSVMVLILEWPSLIESDTAYSSTLQDVESTRWRKSFFSSHIIVLPFQSLNEHHHEAYDEHLAYQRYDLRPRKHRNSPPQQRSARPNVSAKLPSPTAVLRSFGLVTSSREELGMLLYLWFYLKGGKDSLSHNVFLAFLSVFLLMSTISFLYLYNFRLGSILKGLQSLSKWSWGKFTCLFIHTIYLSFLACCQSNSSWSGWWRIPSTFPASWTQMLGEASSSKHLWTLRLHWLWSSLFLHGHGILS